jgi:hypothetical protein
MIQSESQGPPFSRKQQSFVFFFSLFSLAWPLIVIFIRRNWMEMLIGHYFLPYKEGNFSWFHPKLKYVSGGLLQLLRKQRPNGYFSFPSS